MEAQKRDEILWLVLEPTVINLGTQKPLNDGLSKAFRHLTPEERDAVETTLAEHEMALGIACYNIGIAQGVGVKDQLTLVAA